MEDEATKDVWIAHLPQSKSLQYPNEGNKTAEKKKVTAMAWNIDENDTEQIRQLFLDAVMRKTKASNYIKR